MDILNFSNRLYLYIRIDMKENIVSKIIILQLRFRGLGLLARVVGEK